MIVANAIISIVLLFTVSPSLNNACVNKIISRQFYRNYAKGNNSAKRKNFKVSARNRHGRSKRSAKVDTLWVLSCFFSHKFIAKLRVTGMLVISSHKSALKQIRLGKRCPNQAKSNSTCTTHQGTLPCQRSESNPLKESPFAN